MAGARVDEGELPRLLDDAAPAARVPARSGSVHDHPSDRKLAVERFTAGLVIDGDGDAIGLLVERRADRVAIDQGVKRPAVAIQPGGFTSDRRGSLRDGRG